MITKIEINFDKQTFSVEGNNLDTQEVLDTMILFSGVVTFIKPCVYKRRPTNE